MAMWKALCRACYDAMNDAPADSGKDIGNRVLETFAKCEGPGKSTQPLFP